MNKSVAISALFGGVFGAFISLIVHASLFLVSSNLFFAMYFGIMFLIIGLVILYRIYTSPVINSTNNNYRKPLLVSFSILVIMSGIICFLLDHNNLNLSINARIPLFLLLGISLCFALTFAWIDLVNMMVSKIRKNNNNNNSNVVETSKQVYLILGFSIIMGAIDGFLFGFLDIEDTKNKTLFQNDEYWSIPIGFLLGIIAGSLNQTQSNLNQSYKLLSTNSNLSYDDGV